MNNRKRNRTAFHPSVAEANLENRVVLSVGGAVPPRPAPAPPPVYSSVVIPRPTNLQAARNNLAAARALRADYTRQVDLAALDLRNAVASQVSQLYANGSKPTAQQLANFNSSVQGTIDAAALQLSSQAALLPGSMTRLVPSIQSSLLGSGARSLANVLTTAVQSSRNTASEQALQSVIGRAINAVPNQLSPAFNSFFNTTNLSQASVNSRGQSIPLTQFMGQQVASQLANTLGTLAQNFPTVANSVLFPNNTTTSPTQQLFDQFGVQARNALSTVALQVGSELSMFPGSSSVLSSIEPMLLGSSSSSLLFGLQNLPFGTANLGTAVTNVFNGSFNNFLGGINTFFGVPSSGTNTSVGTSASSGTGVTNNLSNLATLPITGLTSLFSPALGGTSFNSGFNNGFAAAGATTPGFVGFGVAPTSFDTNFGTGFSNAVSSVISGLGFVNTPLGTTGTEGGVPVQSR